MVTASLSAAALALLESVGRDPGYLQVPLTQIRRDSRRAVASFLGVEVALLVHGQRLALEHWEPGSGPEDAASSLQIPSSALLGSDHEGAVTLWAGAPGALVDLAADITYALGLPDGDIALDQHLSPAPGRDGDPAGLAGLAAVSQINRAIGVLVESGHPPAQALEQLEAVAREEGRTLPDAARTVLDGA